jgi:hypothetical protein
MTNTMRAMLMIANLTAGVSWAEMGQAQEQLPMQPVGQGPAEDVGRRLTQWFTAYGFAGAMSSGQKLVGGGIKIARLRQKHTYITIANLRFAASPEPNDDAAFFGLFVQSGVKFTAGSRGNHVFYLGVEAGLGAAGYDVRDSAHRRLRTATNSFLLSPHLEYNYHFANHAALVVELKILPGIFNGATAEDRRNPNLTVDPPPWVFGGGVGMAF